MSSSDGAPRQALAGSESWSEPFHIVRGASVLWLAFQRCDYSYLLAPFP